jgi:hypothetical protein
MELYLRNRNRYSRHAIIQKKYWDNNKFHDQLSKLIENSKSLPIDIDFTQSKELAVNIPVNDVGKWASILMIQ